LCRASVLKTFSDFSRNFLILLADTFGSGNSSEKPFEYTHARRLFTGEASPETQLALGGPHDLF
jgi:hypothetical protein